MKNLNTYLKSEKFKVSEKYSLKYFGQVEKSSFFQLHFSSSFSNSLNIFIAFNSFTQNYLFNKVLLLTISLFLQEQLTKMYGLPIFLKQSLCTCIVFCHKFYLSQNIQSNNNKLIFYYLMSYCCFEPLNILA